MTPLAPAPWRAGERAFPESLGLVPSPPKQLYTIGNREILNAPCVAIVGTRYPTPYGLRVTRQLSTTLADAGMCVVSGLAHGIDSCAHDTTLGARGKTVAILGGGVDQIYPPGNRVLYHRIARDGMVMSEFEPGHAHFRGCFPRRNRLIAGLASVTIVVEAGIKSGALITANYAADMGKMVAAVPGPIDAAESAGTNQLLRDGAHVIASVDDAITIARLASPDAFPAALSEAPDADQAAVLATLEPVPLSPDAIADRTGLASHHVLCALSALELQGLVQTLPTGEIRRR